MPCGCGGRGRGIPAQVPMNKAAIRLATGPMRRLEAGRGARFRQRPSKCGERRAGVYCGPVALFAAGAAHFGRE